MTRDELLHLIEYHLVLGADDEVDALRDLSRLTENLIDLANTIEVGGLNTAAVITADAHQLELERWTR